MDVPYKLNIMDELLLGLFQLAGEQGCGAWNIASWPCAGRRQQSHRDPC